MWLAIRRFYWRMQAAKQQQPNPVVQCWDKEKIHPTKPWRDIEYLVVDTETSSLNPAEGEILSIAWVAIKNASVQLDSCEEYFIKAENSVGASAAIHQIRDCELRDGISTQDMFKHLFRAAQNRILIFHHAPLDMGFLNKTCFYDFGLPMLWRVADTLKIEKQRLEQKNMPLRSNSLRLASCRARYNLPPYTAHNALNDALATAELFLAQMAFKGENIAVKAIL